MAKVTIVVEDTDDEVKVNATFDPPANNCTDPDTPAQYTAKAVLLALHEVVHDPAV